MFTVPLDVFINRKEMGIAQVVYIVTNPRRHVL
jgi:hypothetical protein